MGISRRCAAVAGAMALTVFAVLLAPARADAVGVAFCYLEHRKAGDEVDSIRTVKYALIERASRTEALESARANVERTLEEKYSHLVGQSLYEHGEDIDGPHCTTWAFSAGYWTLIQTRFSNSSYAYHEVVAGVGTTEEAALANAIKNLALRNWGWSRRKHGYEGIDHGGSGGGDGDLAIGEVESP